MKLSMTSGIASPWAVYGIEASSWGGDARLKRFYGCAFPLDAIGNFATCAHVLPTESDPEEILVVQHPTDTKCYRLTSPKKHPKWDFAVFKCELETVHPYLWIDELHLGSDVLAYGYYDWRAENKQLIIIPQVHKGHVTATPRIDIGACSMPAPWYQLSFPCPDGFSGSPVYFESGDGAFASGMIAASIQTEIGGISMNFGKAFSGLSIKNLAQELGVICTNR